MRQIILDTETTGLSPEDGHRIIEIGCIELVNRRLTKGSFPEALAGPRGRGSFHVYLNPDRIIDAGAQEVHGLSNAFLADKQRFSEIAEDFIAFISGAELVIHNAAFDVGFLNHELHLLGNDFGPLNKYCSSIIDTLALARKKHPGQRNSLDALCKRYNIDNSRRELHGALLDAEILADVYLSMTGGQMALLVEHENPDEAARNDQEVGSRNLGGTREASALPRKRGDVKQTTIRPQLRVVHCSEEEMQTHQKRLEALQKASNGNCLWLASDAVS